VKSTIATLGAVLVLGASMAAWATGNCGIVFHPSLDPSSGMCVSIGGGNWGCTSDIWNPGGCAESTTSTCMGVSTPEPYRDYTPPPGGCVAGVHCSYFSNNTVDNGVADGTSAAQPACGG